MRRPVQRPSWMALVALAACSSSSAPASAPETDAAPVDATSPDASSVDGSFGGGGGPVEAGPPATFDASVSDASEPGVALDATTLAAAGPDPAPVACDVDGAACPLPESRCADSQWLTFYDDARCVAGQCAWQKRYFACGGFGCYGSACEPAPTK